MISVLTPSIRPQFLDITQRTLEAQTYKDFEWLTEIGLRGSDFGLPRDFNKMLRRAKGEMIVILEDCITIPQDALLRISLLEPEQAAYTFPIQKEDGTYDWRHFKHGPINPDHWEIDFAAAPRQMFFDIGGFDEEYCAGWSWENVEVAWRAQQAGYSFKCLDAPEGHAINHDKLVTHPFRGKLNNNDKRAHQSYLLAQTGSWKLDYLGGDDEAKEST